MKRAIHLILTVLVSTLATVIALAILAAAVGGAIWLARLAWGWA